MSRQTGSGFYYVLAFGVRIRRERDKRRRWDTGTLSVENARGSRFGLDLKRRGRQGGEAGDKCTETHSKGRDLERRAAVGVLLTATIFSSGYQA